MVRRVFSITFLALAVAAALLATVAGALPGDLDSSFNANGKRVFDWGGDDAQVSAVLTQSDGKVVLVGAGQGPFGNHQDMVVARLNPDGSDDATFGNGGRVYLNFQHDSLANAAAFTPDGKIWS